MKTDKGLNRYEIHLTDDLLSQIEDIAVSKFDAKIHHRSGKPMIKEAVIALLQLGINAINDGVIPPKQFNSDNNSDSNQITLDEVNELITERLKPIEDKLNSLNYNYTYNYTYKSVKDTNKFTYLNGETDKLTDNEKELIDKIKAIPSGMVFESQSKLCKFLGLKISQHSKLSKIKKYWLNYFLTEKKGSTIKLTKID